MTGMKAEVEKSTELERRLHRTSLSNMENRRKDAKDVYFGMLGYDITMYMKHAEDLAKKVQRHRRCVGWRVTARSSDKI